VAANKLSFNSSGRSKGANNLTFYLDLILVEKMIHRKKNRGHRKSKTLNPSPIIVHFSAYMTGCVNFMRCKDAQKQLVRTSSSPTVFRERLNFQACVLRDIKTKQFLLSK